MNHLLAVLPVALPILFWASYHYAKDHHLPEPLSDLAISFALGIGSFYLGLAAYASLDLVGLRQDAFALGASDPNALLVYALLVIGPIEEAVKLLPFLLVVLRFRALDEPMDAIVHASFIALGFSAVESWRYLPYLEGWQGAARGFVAPVVHMVFASVWGYRVGRAFLCRQPLLPAILLGFAIAAALHGLYDFLVIALPAWALVAAAILITSLWLWRLALMRELQERRGERCPPSRGRRAAGDSP